ncbi:MAG: glycosyltransferase [Candidatus Latescibacterota bacterium]
MTERSFPSDSPAIPLPCRLSVLIPVYNERFFAEELLERALAAPLPEGVERELVVVDDCSTDGTAEILAQVAARHPEQVRLHHHVVNQGKGAAVRTALAQATGTICLIQDADLEYDPREYAALIRPILDGDADVVYGSRFAPAERRRVLHYWHSLGNRLLTGLSNLFTDLDLTDMETCYKAAKTSILRSIPIRSNRFNLEPELTAKFAKRGCRIYEVPISYRGRSYEEGKKITWRDGIQALWTILRYSLVDDAYDERYGRTALQRLTQTHRYHRWVADAIKPFLGDRVLEIGAGIGSLTQKVLPRVRYLATDAEPFQLEYLASRFAGYPGLEVRRLELTEPEALASLAGAFDPVLCLNLFEQLDDDLAALRALATTLRPGGIAVLMVPQGPWLFGPLDRAIGHRRRYATRDLATLAKAAGFTVTRLRGFNRIGTVPWLLNGRLLRRARLGRVQLKLFDSLVWLWRRIDRLLPWPGLSLLAVLRVSDPPSPPSPTHGGSTP